MRISTINLIYADTEAGQTLTSFSYFTCKSWDSNIQCSLACSSLESFSWVIEIYARENKLYLTCAYTHLCRSLSQFLENKSIRSIFTSAGWDVVSPIRQPSLAVLASTRLYSWVERGTEALREWKLLPNKEIFNRVKSFPGLLWFCFTSLFTFTPLSLNQSDAKLKPNTTCSPAFSRALGCLVGF